MSDRKKLILFDVEFSNAHDLEFVKRTIREVRIEFGLDSDEAALAKICEVFLADKPDPPTPIQ
jgi:hypothetical protein